MSLDYSTHKCGYCQAAKEDITPMLNKREQEDFIEKVYLGQYAKDHLPYEFYWRTANLLQDELYKGYGDAGNLEQDTLRAMRRNCYYFSAAKTYQLVRALNENRSESGRQTFFEKGTEIVADFVGAYLFAEKENALMCGKSAKKWVRSSARGTVPHLEYVTKKDNRVRPAHVVLDGIIRRRDDAFWNTFYPPNGWLCRCTTKTFKEGEDTDLSAFDMDEALNNVPEMFRVNFGKEGVVFTKKHPYFKNVPDEDKNLAKNNFNLKKPYDS